MVKGGESMHRILYCTEPQSPAPIPTYSYGNHGPPAALVTLAACWKGSKLGHSGKHKMDLQQG